MIDTEIEIIWTKMGKKRKRRKEREREKRRQTKD